MDWSLLAFGAVLLVALVALDRVASRWYGVWRLREKEDRQKLLIEGMGSVDITGASVEDRVALAHAALAAWASAHGGDTGQDGPIPVRIESSVNGRG